MLRDYRRSGLRGDLLAGWPWLPTWSRRSWRTRSRGYAPGSGLVGAALAMAASWPASYW